MHISNRGEILNALGRYDEARALFNSALAVWNKELAPDHSYFGDSYNGIGRSYLGQDAPESALAPLERALAIREKSGSEPSQIGETRFLLARALWDSGRDRARARTLAEAAKAAYGEKAQTVGSVSVQYSTATDGSSGGVALSESQMAQLDSLRLFGRP